MTEPKPNEIREGKDSKLYRWNVLRGIWVAITSPHPKPSPKFLEIEVTVRSILRHKEDSDWYVLAIGGAGGFDEVSGTFEPAPTKGMRLRLRGVESEYRGKRQLKVRDYNEIPRELHDPVALALGRKGISRDLADLAEQEFGRDCIRKIALEPSLLGSKAFVRRKPKTLENLVAACRTIGSMSEVERALLEVGTKQKDISKLLVIFDQRHSPYDLVIAGKLSFVKADDLARTELFSKIKPYDENRVDRVEGLVAQMKNDAVQKGHCGIDCEDIEHFLNKQYALSNDLCRLAINNLMAGKGVAKIDENGAQNILWDARALSYETVIADVLHEHLINPPTSHAPYARSIIVSAAAAAGFSATSEQIDGVFNALNSPLSILTGGPGVGKTSSLRLLPQVMRGRILGCALAGRAAAQLEAHSGISSSTIHRLLGLWETKSKPDHSALEYVELLVLDEASMVPSKLLAQLLSAVVRARVPRILLVGDPDQLQPVGFGEAFLDLIASGWADTTRLTYVHRTKEGSGINRFCQDINRNGTAISDYEQVDFTNVKGKSEDKAIDILNETIKKYSALINAGISTNDILVTSRFKARDYGMHKINETIRDGYNFSPEFAAVGEPVIATKNDYEVTGTDYAATAVFNGERGVIEQVSPHELIIEFDGKRRVIWKRKSHAHGPGTGLDWGYALTIHRAQGGQAKHVILVIPPENFIFDKPTLYTGASRAAETLSVVGDLSQIPKILKRGRSRRLTALHYIVGTANIIEKDIDFYEPDMTSVGYDMPAESDGE
jgi:RecD/TraA family predicted helicase